MATTEIYILFLPYYGRYYKVVLFFFLLIRQPPRSPLFPYTPLFRSSQTLEVLVTAGRASGEAEEVNRQRNADNVVQVLTSDVIRSLPNANMADALGRLPSDTIEIGRAHV